MYNSPQWLAINFNNFIFTLASYPLINYVSLHQNAFNI